MALNHSPEFKVPTQNTVQQGFLVPEATILANSEELYYVILYTKSSIYDWNLGLSEAGPCCTPGPPFEQTWKGPPGNATY